MLVYNGKLLIYISSGVAKCEGFPMKYVAHLFQ